MLTQSAVIFVNLLTKNMANAIKEKLSKVLKTYRVLFILYLLAIISSIFIHKFNFLLTIYALEE